MALAMTTVRTISISTYYSVKRFDRNERFAVSILSKNFDASNFEDFWPLDAIWTVATLLCSAQRLL